MKKIGIEIPCYNENDNIREVYSRITEVMSHLNYEYKILFIDNKSIDNSREIIRELADKDERVCAIFNTRNFGAGNSGAYGFFHTPGDAVISLACDLQDPPEMIPEYIRKWEAGYKIVLGKKTSADEKKGIRSLGRVAYYKIMRALINDNDMDQVTGFGLFDREVIEAMKLFNDPNPVFRYNIAEMGYEVGFVEYNQPERKRGSSSYSITMYIDVVINSIINNTKKPIRMLSYIGFITFLLMTVFNIAYLLYSCFSGALRSNAIYIIMFFILQVLFFIIGSLGLLGEYIVDIQDRTKQRPLAFEEDRINYREFDE